MIYWARLYKLNTSNCHYISFNNLDISKEHNCISDPTSFGLNNIFNRYFNKCSSLIVRTSNKPIKTTVFKYSLYDAFSSFCRDLWVTSIKSHGHSTIITKPKGKFCQRKISPQMRLFRNFR